MQLRVGWDTLYNEADLYKEAAWYNEAASYDSQPTRQFKIYLTVGFSYKKEMIDTLV